MINGEQLGTVAEQLRVYDVDQGAWEGETGGFEANAEHVVLHLVKDTTGKDFSDPEIVRSAIAPDSIQYALRFMRWTGQGSNMAKPTKDQSNVTSILAGREDFKSVPLHKLAFMESTAIIARQLHNHDHESTRTMAGANRLAAARQAGRLLVYSASLQAEQFDFDLFEAFDARLASLRQRFGIPEPAPNNVS